MEFINQNWPDILAIIISLFALLFAVASWRKNRAIYNLEYHEFLPDKGRDSGNKDIRKKLRSGNYTVLHSNYRSAQYNVLLGKLKK